MGKVSIPTLLIALLVIFILLTYTCTYQVGFNELAVKVRFGQADQRSIIREPGLRFRWPWPIESIQKYDKRLRTLDTPETEVKTFDGKNVIIGAYAVWRIEDPLQFYKRVRTVAEAERQMRSRISQVQVAVIGQSTLADFVNLDQSKKDQTYDRMLTQMRDLTETRDGEVVHVGVWKGLMEDYGIDVHKIGIRRISLPEETTQQVFRSMQQERNKLAARFRQEGKSRATAIEARANSSAVQILEFAKRRAQEIKSAGVRAATRIYAQIPEQDRDFFEYLLWLEGLRAMLSQKTTIFLDKDSPLWQRFVPPPVQPQGQP